MLAIEREPVLATHAHFVKLLSRLIPDSSKIQQLIERLVPLSFSAAAALVLRSQDSNSLNFICNYAIIESFQELVIEIGEDHQEMDFKNRLSMIAEEMMSSDIKLTSLTDLDSIKQFCRMNRFSKIEMMMKLTGLSREALYEFFYEKLAKIYELSRIEMKKSTDSINTTILRYILNSMDNEDFESFHTQSYYRLSGYAEDYNVTSKLLQDVLTEESKRREFNENLSS